GIRTFELWRSQPGGGTRGAARPGTADPGRSRRDQDRGRGRHRRLRAWRAPPPGLRDLCTGDRARCRSHTNGPDSPFQRRYGHQLGRSGPRLPGFRDARSALRRARGNLGRTRFVHRILPALWTGSGRLRRPLRRKAGPAAGNPGAR
ncbi:MAG: Putative oxidoreductase, partial [uncultured Thermomicrobiales bacterium]